MDSPQKKDASMDGSEKTPLPHLLPVTVAKKTPRPDVVRRVSAWVLFNASIFALSFAVGFIVAYALDHFHVPSSQYSFFLPSHQLTDAEEAVVISQEIGILCCVTLQAAAAVLALWLPCRRRWVPRALAYLALALTIVCHCIYAAAAARLFLHDIFFIICFAAGIVFIVVGDIISFLALLLGGDCQ